MCAQFTNCAYSAGHALSWADLEGPQICHLCFLYFCGRPQKPQSARGLDSELVSGAELCCNLRYFSSRGRSRGSRAPPWAPRGRKSAENRGRIYHFILPKVCPVHTGPGRLDFEAPDEGSDFDKRSGSQDLKGSFDLRCETPSKPIKTLLKPY